MTNADALNTDYGLALRLRRTWDAFFARFGRLLEVQRRAIPPILDGTDVLICAPTAAGKTEAVCAPAIERLLKTGARGLILYVCPTRALVNDVFERLQGPFETLGLHVTRRTGDHRDAVQDGAQLLITTPESFDSLMCRGRPVAESSHALSRVEAVVLDEIHLLHNTARGEQVRWLLERIARLRRYSREQGWVTSSHIQHLALSATVSDPAEVLAAFLPNGIAIAVEGSRDIAVVAADAPTPAVEEQLPKYLDTISDPEKILVFSNQRKRVDTLSVALRPALEARGYVVRAHHGSLSREEREATEREVKRSDRIIVFSTSTLEIGVDIGDIDLVVLDGPPPDVASLLQRVGRGNRRTGTTRVMQCAATAGELVIQAAMLGAARDGELARPEKGPHYAVARQQLASFVFQAPRRARARSTLLGLLEACIPTVEGTPFLDHLVSSGDLEESGDGVRLGEHWRDASADGGIHSNIESAGGSVIVDDQSGQGIAGGIRFKGGSGLSVAGNLLHIRERDDWRLYVNRVNDPRLAAGLWSYVSKGWMQGAGQAHAVRRYLGFLDDDWPMCFDGSRSFVFHFGGSRRRAALDLLIRSGTPSNVPVGVDAWTIRFDGEIAKPPQWITDASAASLKVSIPSHLSKLERTLVRPSANRHLPEYLRVREVQEWLNIDDEVATIKRARWIEARTDEQHDAMLLLAKSLYSTT
jgi:ATP-dependent Lhr-like helicase